MTLAIMQPYFLPYIGYFQLMNAVDCFVVYDNIQFTKKGWIHRNRFLLNGSDWMFTLPLKKDSDYLDVCHRKLADTFASDRSKMLAQLAGAYRKAPMFEVTMPVIEKCFQSDADNLFEFILHSLHCIRDHLGISSKLVVSSSVDIDHNLKGQDKVIAICETLNAIQYVNPQGGLTLYNKDVFNGAGLELSFLQPKEITYLQFQHEHVPWLSIVDVMMFNPLETITSLLDHYTLTIP